MNIIDISLPLRPGVLVYPGDPELQLRPCVGFDPADPDSFRLSELQMCTHTGTHIDPPSHFLPDGASVDAIPLEQLCGSARVVDLRGLGSRGIDVADLEPLGLESVERLLLKTDNGNLLDAEVFRPDYTHLTLDGAAYLVSQTRVRLVGIDYLSIEASHSPGYPVHRALLEGEVVILEGIDLRHVASGDYTLWCMPLRLVDGDGGPARAALVPEEIA